MSNFQSFSLQFDIRPSLNYTCFSMKVIGLTGGIGSGKSTVAKFLVEMGAYLLDADTLGHEVFQPGTPGWRDVVAAFGREILKPDNQIDRARLGRMVFGKPQELNKLNRILHPRITELAKSKLEQLKQQGTRVVVLEAILLIEGGWRPLVDEVWVTVASETTILKRLKNRNGYSEEESLSRIHSQVTNEERKQHADVVVDTDCSLAELRKKVGALWGKIII